jgi:hypothetical protein
MNIPRWGGAAGLLVVLSGCEHGPPVAVQPVPEPSQAASVSLSPAAREQLTGKIDLGAVDRLLPTLTPEDRARFLHSFQDVEWAAHGRTDVETRDVTVIVQYGDPERQRLLEQAWAPFWSQLPSAVLSDPSYPLPGRTLAAARKEGNAPATDHRKEREP